MDELIQEFLVEGNENLDRFDGDLVKLEAEPANMELLSGIFRSIHSIKGACGFLGFQKLEKLAHAGENLLSKLRDGQLLLRADIGSALLEAGDRIRQMLAASGAGADGEEEFQELIERLKALQEPGGAAEKTRPEAAQVTAEKRICPPAPPAVVETPRAELVAKKSEEGQVPPAAKAAAETESRVAEESARVT